MSIEEFINHRLSNIIGNAEFYESKEGWCQIKSDTDIVVPKQFRSAKFSYICELITEYIDRLGNNWKLDDEDGLGGIGSNPDDDDWYIGFTLLLYRKDPME